MLISFKILNAFTEPGQTVHLVGSIKELGLWNVSFLKYFKFSLG